MPPSVSRFTRSTDMWSRVNRSFTLMGTAVSLWPVVSYTIRVTPVSTLSMAEVSRLSPSKSVSV